MTYANAYKTDSVNVFHSSAGVKKHCIFTTDVHIVNSALRNYN